MSEKQRLRALARYYTELARIEESLENINNNPEVKTAEIYLENTSENRSAKIELKLSSPHAELIIDDVNDLLIEAFKDALLAQRFNIKKLIKNLQNE